MPLTPRLASTRSVSLCLNKHYQGHSPPALSYLVQVLCIFRRISQGTQKAHTVDRSTSVLFYVLNFSTDTARTVKGVSMRADLACNTTVLMVGVQLWNVFPVFGRHKHCCCGGAHHPILVQLDLLIGYNVNHSSHGRHGCCMYIGLGMYVLFPGIPIRNALCHFAKSRQPSSIEGFSCHHQIHGRE